MTTPRIGEQIISPITEAPVKDPAPQPPTSPSGLSTGPEAGETMTPPPPAPVVDAAPADAPAPVVEWQENQGPSILLEGGQGKRVPCNEKDMRQFRVAGLDGLYYEHVSNAPDGEWEYRQSN